MLAVHFPFELLLANLANQRLALPLLQVKSYIVESAGTHMRMLVQSRSKLSLRLKKLVRLLPIL